MRGVVIIKIGLYAAVLAAGQLVMGPFVAERCEPAAVGELEALAAAAADVVFLGDSTAFMTDAMDTDTRDTAALLDESLPDFNVGAHLGPGYTLTDYALQVDFLVRHGLGGAHGQDRPVVIVPLNMRSFSPLWHDNPFIQRGELRLFLGNDGYLFRSFYKPLAAFGAFPDATPPPGTFLKQPIYDGKRQAGVAGDVWPFEPQTDTETGRLLAIAHHMQPVTAQHDLLEAGERLAAACRAGSLRLFIYVTPVDYTTGDEVLEGRFSRRLRRNVDTAVSLLRDQDVNVVDLSFAFGPELFRTGHYPAEEHLNEQGRRRLAGLLRAEVVKLLERDATAPAAG